MNKSLPVLIIPVLNRYDLLDALLDSINYPVDNIVVIDNGGKYSRNQNNLTILNMPNNIGVASSWNLGIKCFPEADYWTFSAIDVILKEDTIQKTALYSKRGVMNISNYGFSYFSIGADFLEEVGLFDENFFPAYYEDEDFEKRARVMGLGNRIVYPDIIIDLYDTCTTAKSEDWMWKEKERTDIINKKYIESKFKNNNFNYNKISISMRNNNIWRNFE